MRINRFFEQDARLVSENHRTIDGGDVGISMAQVALELVYIVRSLAAATCMLAVHWIDAQSARSHT